MDCISHIIPPHTLILQFIDKLYFIISIINKVIIIQRGYGRTAEKAVRFHDGEGFTRERLNGRRECPPILVNKSLFHQFINSLFINPSIHQSIHCLSIHQFINQFIVYQSINSSINSLFINQSITS